LTGFGEDAGLIKTIAIDIDDTVYALLGVLTEGECAPGSVEDVVLKLIAHAQQGVYRPGAWERGWLIESFGDDWTAELEPIDP
jgi:hypothetical protein